MGILYHVKYKTVVMVLLFQPIVFQGSDIMTLKVLLVGSMSRDFSSSSAFLFIIRHKHKFLIAQKSEFLTEALHNLNKPLVSFSKTNIWAGVF